MLLGLSPCLLETEDDALTEISLEPDPSRLENVVYNYSAGTYTLTDTLWMSTINQRASISARGDYLRQFAVLLNGTDSLPTRGTSATLEIRNLSSGYYPLVMHQYLESGTGSLADAFGVELTLYERSVILAVDIPFDPPEIRSITLEDGTVRLEWETCFRGDFQAYEVWDAGFGSRSELIYRTEDRSQIVAFDSLYVGEAVSFRGLQRMPRWVASGKPTVETLLSGKIPINFWPILTGRLRK